MTPSHPKPWRNGWLRLAALALCSIFIFYSVENRRGQKAWQNCQRAIESSRIQLAWTNYTPPSVPDDQNVFGVTEMRRWFQGMEAGWPDLVSKLPNPDFPAVRVDTNTPRFLVAQITIVPASTPAPATALRWDDPATPARAAQLLTTALGPIGKAPQSSIGIGLMLRRPEEIQPAQILLRCLTAPTQKMLEDFFPDTLVEANLGPGERVLKFEPDGPASWRVTMPVLARAADYLAWSDGLTPQLDLIRRALRRPYSCMPGIYENPNRVPTANFHAARNLVQLLGARADAHLLLGQPEEALRDLSLIHSVCRIFEEHKPMDIVSAMLNVAVNGLLAAQIADGLRLHAWQESQLATLENQLKTIDVLPPMKQALTLNAIITFNALQSVPSAGLETSSAWFTLVPRGWGYEHMAARVQIDFDRLSEIDPTNHLIYPDKVKSGADRTFALKHRSFYAFAASLDPANFTRAFQLTAHAQTEINQARIACALERYRLAHGEYPETLDALVPRYLDQIPNDIIGGHPPHYRHASDGTFILYSTGWTMRDRGGIRGKTVADLNSDWIWPD